MEKEIRHTTKIQRRISLISIGIIALLAGILFWIVYMFWDERRFAVVKFTGDNLAINLSKNYNLTGFRDNKQNAGALLAEKGDLLVFNNSFIYFDDVREDSIELNDEGDSLIFMNGKVSSIIISGKENLLPWFKTVNAASISNLQSICINSKIPESYLPFLKEIASLKKQVALSFGDADSTDVMNEYLTHADFFDPRFVRVSLTQNNIAALSGWKKIECIYLEVSDSVFTSSLPSMPALKQCILFGEDLKQIPASFFSNNLQLKRLTLVTAFNNYEALRPLNKLQELSVNNPNGSADITVLNSKIASLSVFIVSGNYNPVAAIPPLNKLRWLGLPQNTTQLQFNAIATQLPNLQVLQISGSDSIRNLAALKKITNLKGLVITDTVTDKQSLYALKGLRYLSVPGSDKKDSIYMRSLQKALPGCIVVPNSGACLGSGWLLLLVPLALLFALLAKQFHLKSDRNEVY